MRFNWDEQQEMLRSTVHRFVADRHGFEDHRKRLAGGANPETWQEMAELGLLAVPFAEEFGGIGGGPLEMAIVMREFGRGLVLEPYLSTVALAGGLVQRLGSADQKTEILPRIISGELRLAFAFAEPQSRFNLGNVTTSAIRTKDGFTLSGRKSVVLGAPHAQAAIVTASTQEEVGDAQGISVFIVGLDTPGVDLRPYLCVDGFPAAEVDFKATPVPNSALVGPLGGALPGVEAIINEATVAICAEAVGAMEALNERCVEFSQTRKAFGQTIGEFQAIRHRLVDMRISAEQAGAITLKAASDLASDSPAADQAVSACKALVGEEAAFVGKNALQLHGAIGMTDELDIGHYFRRLMAIQATFGSADDHLRRYINSKEAVGDGH